MPSLTRQTLLFTLVSLMVGCSFLRSSPDPTQVETAVKATLPAYWDFTIGKIESNKIRENVYEVTFKGTLSPKEDLFIIADVAQEYQKHGLSAPKQGLNAFGGTEAPAAPLKLLTLDAPAKQSFEVYGKCAAEYTVDKWNVSFGEFDSPPNHQGKPRSAYGTDFLVMDSPEANATFAKLLQQQKDTAEKQQQFLTPLLAVIQPGAVFEGAAVYQQKFGDPTNTQKIRITFNEVSPDGKTVKAVVSNPDDSMDSVPFEGKIVTDTAAAYPIDLLNDRSKASRRDQTRSWRYYTQIGVHFWLTVKDSQLVGKGGFDLNHQDYDIQAQKK